MAGTEALADLKFIQQVDVSHFSHTDCGFADHPAVCRDMQRRYLDVALDAALGSAKQAEAARFHWPAETTATLDPALSVAVDKNGWPVSAMWTGMTKPLFTTCICDFAPRWTLADIWSTGDPAKRELMRTETFEQVAARARRGATVEDTPHTLRYTQPLEHPRLAWATREVELWKREPRTRFTVRINRLSSFRPEVFALAFLLPCDGTLPRLTCGGLPFTPFRDQLGRSCRDYFAVDGWASYATPGGCWLWVSRDAPMLTFDELHLKQRLSQPPPRTGRLLSILYDNVWYTNFLSDEPGVMEFRFDLVWQRSTPDATETEALAAGLLAEPNVIINPSNREHPALTKRLFAP